MQGLQEQVAVLAASGRQAVVLGEDGATLLACAPVEGTALESLEALPGLVAPDRCPGWFTPVGGAF